MSAIPGATPATPWRQPTWRKSVPKPLMPALAPRHPPASLSKDESNIQHPTSDVRHPNLASMAHRVFDVDGWMLDVFAVRCGNPARHGLRLQRRVHAVIPFADRSDKRGGEKFSAGC